MNEGIVFYDATVIPWNQETTVERLYNPNSGQHFYTSNWDERDYLKKIGWHDEGEAFSFTSPEPLQTGPAKAV